MQPQFMQEALQLAYETMRRGQGGPFGAVVVRGQEIIGRGSNRVLGTHDPTAHAEIVAIREACQKTVNFRLDGCEIYTTCEPCPMCLSAIYWARIRRVYFAASRSDAAKAGFMDEFLYRELALPPDRRRVPMTQLLRSDAVAALDEWEAMPNKIVY